jgi:threonine/homoserine/homoserine lactone efflux protein
MPFFLKGLAIGFLIAAPVGPIGMLCIRRSLVEGMRSGFVTGMGAATADAAYGSVAAFGLTAISSVLLHYQTALEIFGGAFLIYLGVRAFISSPPDDAAQVNPSRLVSAYVSTVLLTVANPATILSFTAVFLGFGVGGTPGFSAATALVAGVFLGSASWWLILSTGVNCLRSRLGPHWTRHVNQLSGAILAAFGLCAMARPLFR